MYFYENGTIILMPITINNLKEIERQRNFKKSIQNHKSEVKRFLVWGIRDWHTY